MDIRLENVSKHFSDVKAVDAVTLDVKGGKLIGLLGPSGCGKSTTLYLISGLEKPTSGKLIFDGKDVTALEPEERGIGLVFQNYALYPHMTVLANILFPLQNQKVPKAEALERAKEMAKLVKVDALLNRKPGQLSGGQQQRVAIARALVKKPNLLLLDEPLSNLDARLRLEMREEIRRIQRETGITTIFVTHDQDEAMSICDEIVLMKDGKVLQQCAPQDMYTYPDSIFVASFLGNPPINLIKASYKDNTVFIEGQKPFHLELEGSGECTIGVRAEWFTDGDAFEVTIDDFSLRGRDKLAYFNFGGSRAVALIDNLRYIENGDKLKLDVKGHMMYVFDKDGVQINRNIKNAKETK